MLEKLAQTLSDECGLGLDAKLLVGVSGGTDSLSLLHALNQLNVPVVAGHFNHHLREDAHNDADFVEVFAEQYGIRCVVGAGDTKEFAQQQGLSIEEAARELRYRFLFEQAEALEVDAVAVAHTADDQVETVMMHLIRGAGLDGLTGMRFVWQSPWHDEIPLIRPALGIWKHQLEAYCSQHNLNPRFDRSNLDTTFFRNKIRHDVLPVLTDLNPNFGKLVWQTADILTRDQKYLQESVQKIWQSLVLEKTDSHVAFRRADFEVLHEAVQRRILRTAIETLRPAMRDIGFDAIKYGLTLIHEPPAASKADLIAELYLQVEEDRVIIAEWGVALHHPDYPHLGHVEQIGQLPVKMLLEDGWVFTVEKKPAGEMLPALIFQNDDPFTAYLDGGKISSPLTLRHRKDGDRFRPLGMGGQDVNLADFMINAKIPVRARDHWPLVCSGGEIVWLPGYRIDERYRVVEKTQELWVLRLFQEE